MIEFRRRLTAQSMWKRLTANVLEVCVRRNCRHLV